MPPPKKRCPGRRADPRRDGRGYPAAALARALLPWLAPMCLRPRPALHLSTARGGGPSRPCAASGDPSTREKVAAPDGPGCKKTVELPKNSAPAVRTRGAGSKGELAPSGLSAVRRLGDPPPPGAMECPLPGLHLWAKKRNPSVHPSRSRPQPGAEMGAQKDGQNSPPSVEGPQGPVTTDKSRQHGLTLNSS
jgi:hypothetical protein